MHQLPRRRGCQTVKVLISAYVCSPYQGSEGAIGWNWALEVAQTGHETWVIANSENENEIERFLSVAPVTNLHVTYVQGESPAPFLGPFGYIAETIRWQSAILSHARALDERIDFDIVHHVSTGSLHIGSKLWQLGKPFIFGPIGGGQQAPLRFWRYLRGGLFIETIRTLVVRYLSGTIFSGRAMARKADLILYANQETRDWLHRLGACNTSYMPAAGVPAGWFDAERRPSRNDKALRVFWLGRLLPRKAVMLALDAMACLDASLPVTCTIVGDGRQGEFLNRWIAERNLGSRVTWVGRIDWSEISQVCREHDVFLFTSVRDTDGNQLVEAMSQGCAVVTLNHQGARDLVWDTAGTKVPVTTPNETAAALAKALDDLVRNPDLLEAKRRAAFDCARSHAFDTKAKVANDYYLSLTGATEVAGAASDKAV